MLLSQGSQLGPYEILSPVGAGGMGEVYRARDSRLRRTVAIKVLPQQLAADPDVRQRFEREAKAISALNHPHICVLHDVGHQDGIDYLVMEYLEGETLAQRVRRRRLPLEQCLRSGMEIADALDAAHKRGIVHRDLKPGNVMLTKSGAKLLDFGLAKLKPPKHTTDSGFWSQSTEDRPLTSEGTISGTLPYMAPEQVEGKEPDARTDIWALGCVIYEMATGKRAFSGESQSSLTAAILKDSPAPMASVEPLTPATLEHAVATCLAKDPEDRWQSAHDLANELKWIAAASSDHVAAPRAGRRPRSVWAWVASAAATLALAVSLFYGARRAPEGVLKPAQVRFVIPPPDKTTFDSSALAVSPDGDRIAFVAHGESGAQLFVRSLASPNAVPVASVTTIPPQGLARYAFWSPDGRYLGFRVSGPWIRTMELASGAVRTLPYRIGGVLHGASWSCADDIILSDDGELYLIQAASGTARQLGKRVAGEVGRFGPYFLPDGRHYLYFSKQSQPEQQGIYVASLDSDDRKRLVASDRVNAAYSKSGHLFFMKGTTLMAQAFDVRRFELLGPAVAVAESVASIASGYGVNAAYSVSSNGVVAWQPGAGEVFALTWFDRSGKKLGSVGVPDDYSTPALSPDGRRLAVTRRNAATTIRDVWIVDLENAHWTRLTFDPHDNFGPVWSPDGSRIAFTSDRGGNRDLYCKPANGTADDELLLATKDWWKTVEDWSPDGRFLAYNYYNHGKASDLYLLPLFGDRKLIPFVATEFIEFRSQFSPNGRWLGYVSDATGRNEIYVQGLSPDGSPGSGKWQVSTSGGQELKWRADGRELFYVLYPDLMAVDVRTDAPSFQADVPRLLFKTQMALAGRNRFVVTKDGQRFLVPVPVEQPSEPIQVLLNWRPEPK